MRAQECSRHLSGHALLKRGIVDCALVVSGGTITHLTRKAQQEIYDDLDARLPCLTLGDAGAAMAHTHRRRKNRVSRYRLIHARRHHALCIAKLSDREPAGPIMITDLFSMSEVTAEKVMKHWPTVAVRHGWGIHNVRHIIPHQVSNTTLNNGLFAVKDLSIATTSTWCRTWPSAPTPRPRRQCRRLGSCRNGAISFRRESVVRITGPQE